MYISSGDTGGKRLPHHTGTMAGLASAFSAAVSESVSTSASNGGSHVQSAVWLLGLLSQPISSCLSISKSPLSQEFKPPCLSSYSFSSRFFWHTEVGGGHSGLSVTWLELGDNWKSLPYGLTNTQHVGFCCLVAKLCLTLWDPTDCSPPGSSAHRISQARILV